MGRTRGVSKKEAGNMRKAYILSSKNGVVQIGNTVFCVPTMKAFHATMKGLKGLPYVMVREKSFTAAEEALWEYKIKGAALNGSPYNNSSSKKTRRCI